MSHPPASSSDPATTGPSPSSASPIVLAERYRIEREIGRGGMAVVSLAHDLKHDRRVAVKFIGEQLSNAVGTQRFLQEIKLTASLQHPHVLSVYDSGVTADSILFYVMPYVEGGSLRGVMRERGMMPLRDVLRIAREVADALSFAHARGIVHRDIKPENILFSEGHALVADFGIARMLAPQTGEQYTLTGVVVGTPAYMSPEQAFGLPLDARSDVYSLACVVWEMLTGHAPAIIGGMGWPPKIRERTDVPAAIEAELVKSLSPNADERHAGTRELADALEGLAPSMSRSTSHPVPARRGWRAGLLAGFAIGILALAGSAFLTSPMRSAILNRESLAALGSTRSLTAWSAYARGQQALDRWDLRAADSAFAAAVAADPRFGAARVWLAQTMVWSRRASRGEWRRHVDELATNGIELRASDQRNALALAAIARRDEPAACDVYRPKDRRDSLDARVWLRLGDCQALDDAVVEDPGSPTGFRFRASWDAAMRAYERAVLLAPGAYAALPAAYVERLLPAVPARFRPGMAVGDTARGFAAQPSASGDTVAYYPRPLDAGGISVDPPRFEEALQRNGARLLAYVSAWTVRAPASVEAYEALSGVQEARGELSGMAAGGRLSAAAALDSAGTITADAAARARIAASRARILVKAGEFERASRLADSLINDAGSVTAAQAHWLAGIAALTGRVNDAARLGRLGRTPPVDWDTLPAPLSAAATLLLLQSAAGICNDAFTAGPQRLEEMIESYIVPANRPAVRTVLMSRATRLAVPCLGSESIASLDARSPWDRMQLALARGDRRRVRVVFDSMMAARRDRRPGGTAVDYIYVGAWTLAAAGDTAAAERYADLTLNALPTLSRNAVWELTQAAALVRTMAWRAELAHARRDSENAARWAAAVAALWKNADPELQPTVGRMRSIAKSR